jgi:hypothetical protein
MIFGADVGVSLPPPSFASISQPLEKCSYYLAHAREDIPSGIGARGLWVLDQSDTNFSQRIAVTLTHARHAFASG